MKVLIVDDEAMICEWLQFCISQNTFCHLIGTARNGLEALELFQKEEADLVLTDIKMPLMNGLELLHELRNLNPNIKVVMLTAFSDFELVRQALRDGAYEYLLKTEMQNEMLQELLNRIANELHLTQNEERPDDSNFSQAHSTITRILRQARTLSDEDLEKLHQCNIRWRNNGLFALAVWKKDMLHHVLSFPQDSHARHVASFDYTDRIYMVVGNFPKTLSFAEKARLLRKYAQEVHEINGCIVGISSITDEIRQIPFMVWQASCSLGESFYWKGKTVYEPRYCLKELSAKHQIWKNDLTQLRVKLHSAKGYQRYETIREFLKNAAAKPILSIELICQLCSDALDLLEFDAKETEIVLENVDVLRTALQQCISAEEADSILHTVADQCHFPATGQLPKSNNIRLAVEYIQLHYSEQLSLEQVASQVYLNPDYFSRAFRQETGQTFINYLTDIRLEHSVQLLENTALRVQSIAQKVGYYNASYFSTTFKKKYGMSPYDYRRNNITH